MPIRTCGYSVSPSCPERRARLKENGRIRDEAVHRPRASRVLNAVWVRDLAHPQERIYGPAAPHMSAPTSAMGN
jgi:hypothetical protein